MIIGTAGHIDHGKTTLVRALTGVDTDRLPEERARGISIELGYAFLDVPGATERIGFIDVPGHERLVHTMLAGATGIAYALLLVAADDGVMPQTREHLAVLSMLGIARGAVVVTKIDRVDAARVDTVVAEAEALVASSTLAASAVHRVSATTGEGIGALREALFDAARAVDSAISSPSEDADQSQAGTTLPPLPLGEGRGEGGAAPTLTPALSQREREEDMPGARAFRLAIDRAFTLAGIGTVVTGTVHAGRVQVGDTLVIAPALSTTPLSARVRSLHAQNTQVHDAHAGQRCAVGLAGIAKADVRRGQWLVAPAVALSTTRIDCRLTLWRGEAKALRSGTPVHVHIGACATMASVAVLGDVWLIRGTRNTRNAQDTQNTQNTQDTQDTQDTQNIKNIKNIGDPRHRRDAWDVPERQEIQDTPDAHGTQTTQNPPAPPDAIAPGATAFVQLVLHEPIAAWRGDRVVLRDASASRTIAGGTVLDPFAPARYRRTPQRLGELAAWSQPGAEARLQALVDAAPHGLSTTRWSRAEGVDTRARAAALHTIASLEVTQSTRESITRESKTRESITREPPTGALQKVGSPTLDLPDLHATDAEDTWLLGARHRDALHRQVTDALRAFHAREPELLGPDSARLRRLVAPRLPEPLWRELLLAMAADATIATRGAYVHLPEHGLRLSAADERLAQKIAPSLVQSGFEGVWARDLARDTRESEVLLRTTLARLAQRGELHQVVRDLFFANDVMAQLATHVRAVSAAHAGVVTAARFRDATGLGRKRAIQILEYFDRIGLLRRVGDEHRLRSDTLLFSATGDQPHGGHPPPREATKAATAATAAKAANTAT